MRSKKLIILGAGNALIDIIEIALYYNMKNIEIYDDKLQNKKILDFQVLGNFKKGIKKNLGKSKFIFCFGTALTVKNRERLFKKYNFSKNDLQTLVHPKASVSKYAKLGKGVIIKSNAVILPNAKIGDNVIISQLSSISHNVTIGSHSVIAPSASCSGGSKIGKCCFLGTNCTINENINIGDNSIVGLGANVIKSIKKNTIFYEKK